MATKKRKQKQTLREFRAWLQGVEELQPDNWSPDRDQWHLIRDRIDGIIVEKKVVEKAIPAGFSGNLNHQKPPEGYQPAPQVGGLPNAEVDMTPAARQMLYPAAGEKAVTPNIDTSDGHVESPFA